MRLNERFNFSRTIAPFVNHACKFLWTASARTTIVDNNHISNILPDDVINIVWHPDPEVTYQARITCINTQRWVVKPVILVSFEEVRHSIDVSEDSIYRRWDTLPVIADWPRVAWVYFMTVLVVAIVVWSQEEIDESIWPAEYSINCTGSLSLRKQIVINEIETCNKRWVVSVMDWSYTQF